MKKTIKYLPYFLYLFAFISFILPSLYLKESGSTLTFSFLELTFGKDAFEFSIGLFIVFMLFITTIVLSILLIYKDSKLLTNITIILGLSSGILTFFQRLLSSPTSTEYLINIGLFLPGILIITGTIILFINKKIIKQNA